MSAAKGGWEWALGHRWKASSGPLEWCGANASAIGEGKMRMTALEGIIENGQVKLSGDVCLPENAKVYLLVVDVAIPIARVVSPRLVHPEQLVDFQMEVTAPT
jgi:hypothetical protein